jgi:hypothetical protein
MTDKLFILGKPFVNAVWWPEWGEKPDAAADQYRRLRQIFSAAPTLIPLFGHRYIPEEPFETGNPVLSTARRCRPSRKCPSGPKLCGPTTPNS